MLNETTIQEFAVSINGQVIRPQDADYETSRKVYNAMIDRKPQLIVKCADVADVIACVQFAKETDTNISIRGGGHNGAGLAVCDDCLVIDLSNMRGIRVDPGECCVRVEGGCRLHDVDHATAAFGMAVPAGVVSTTGVAGLTLGGGLGHLSRQYGLSIDNLLEVDVVLADGTFTKASEEMNPDLFWAIRGGGGNFGVITSFLFKMRPASMIFGGPTLWTLDQAPEIMKWYRDFILSAPRELNGFFAFMTVPPSPAFPENLHFQKCCGVVWCYNGDADKAEGVFDPIKNHSVTPLLHGVQEMPYRMLNSMFDELYPPGYQWYWKADFVKEISDEAIDRHMEYARQMPTMHSAMHMYPIDGAVHHIGANDTAFSYRESNWAQVIVGVDPDPANRENITTWAKNYYEALHPFSSGGAYINFMMEEGEDRIKATYRDNYDQLVEVKTKYDPENLFRVNQNIPPKPGAGRKAA